MMIPPIDPLVLKTNPEFAKLYSSLTRDVLAEDGSTKNDAATKQRCETRLVSHDGFPGINNGTDRIYRSSKPTA